MGAVIGALIMIVLVSALTIVIYTNTEAATDTGGSLENLSATEKQVLNLTPLLWVFLPIGIIAAVLYKMFK